MAQRCSPAFTQEAQPVIDKARHAAAPADVGQGPVPVVMKPGTVRTPVHNRVLALPAGLISALLFFQLFDYQLLEPFRLLTVLFTVTPDRLVFLLIASVFVWSFVNGRVRPSPFGLIEVCMLLLAALCTISWLATRPDAGLPRFKWLTTLFNFIFLPFGIYLIAKNTRYSRAKTAVVLRTIAAIGVYLSLTAVLEHFERS